MNQKRSKAGLGGAFLHDLSMVCIGVDSHDVGWCNVSCSTLQLLLGSGLLVKEVQICLPANGNDTAKNASVLDRHVGEAEGGDCRPDLAAVPPAGGHGVFDALDNLGKGATRKERLHAEEVGIEQWGEECLVDEDLRILLIWCKHMYA